MTKVSKESPVPEHSGKEKEPSWPDDSTPKRSSVYHFIHSVNRTNRNCSPNASPICNLNFQGHWLQIHEDFLRSSAELASRCRPALLERTGLKNVYFDEISIDVGHVIVNFLTTGEYSRSKTHGERIAREDSSEFLTALRVCAAAESLKLPTLRNLATTMAKDLCTELHVLSIVQLTHDLSSVPAEVVSYITRRVKQFCEELTEESATLFLLEVASPKTACELLLKTVMELKVQQLSRDRELREEEVTAAGLHGQVCEWPEQIYHCAEHPISAASNPFVVFTPSDHPGSAPITPPTSPEFYQTVLNNLPRVVDWTEFFVSSGRPKSPNY